MPKVVWFTGLSGAGKSTLAELLQKEVGGVLLDGDIIRKGLCSDLTFSAEDRKENIRRISEVARLFNINAINVTVAFISPFLSDRMFARNLIGKDFVEVYVSTSLEVCQKRDVKGLYKLALEGTIKNFTGISSPYEPPLSAELSIDTSNSTPDSDVKQILDFINK